MILGNPVQHKSLTSIEVSVEKKIVRRVNVDTILDEGMWEMKRKEVVTSHMITHDAEKTEDFQTNHK